MAKSKSTKPELSYEAARLALDKIIREIQSDNTSIDVLAEKIKHAQDLIKYCQSKLRNIETDVKALLNDEEE